jgi:aminoglycoside phosphotransferase (APT) family kinase protein/SAM-dependent methyltransferase
MGPPVGSNGKNGSNGSVVASRMRQLADDAATRGWQDAHDGFSGEVLSGRLRAPAGSRFARLRAKLTGHTWEDTLQDLVDPTRAGWKFLLDLRPTARVCVLGPSWGAAPLALARSCARVLLLDGAVDRLTLALEQARAEGLTNVTAATVHDPVRLPLGDATVDLVVVPGLAEWIEAVAGEVEPPVVAGDLLHEIRRVLSPHGQAYVATDNPFGPVRLLDARGRQVPRYSAKRLRRVARAAGFTRTEVFAPLPFRHKFHQVLDVGRTDRLNFCLDPYRTRGRLLRPLVKLWDRCNTGGRIERRLYPLLPSLGAVLSVDDGATSYAERIVAHVARQSGTPPTGLPLARYYVRPKGVVVLVAGSSDSGGVIVRLPLGTMAAANCERQHHALKTLAADERIPATLGRLFPRPLADGVFDGQTFFAETGLVGELGRRYYSLPERRFDRAILEAAAVLCELRRATERPVRITATEYERLCGAWLAELRATVGEEKRGTLDIIDTLLRDTLLGRTLPLGWHHGDYDFANLLYGEDDRVTGILDFEVFEPEGLPLVDLLVLLARRPIRRQGVAFGTLFVRAILDRALPPLETELLERELATLGIDDRLYRALAICCWLNHLRLRRDSWLVRSPSWLDDNLHTVIDSVRRTLG